MGAHSKMLAAGAAVAAAAVAAVAVPAGADHRPACVSKGSTTVAASKNARVFTKRGTERPSYRVTRYYACSYRYNRKFRISVVGEPGVFVTAVEPIRLAGRHVAHGSYFEGPADGSYANVLVRDLRDGRVIANVEAGEPDDGPHSSERQRPIADLELRPNGSVAWIEASTSGPGVTTYRVVKNDSGGRVVLDSGSDIEPRSLALSGARLYWTKAGSPAGAVLD